MQKNVLVVDENNIIYGDTYPKRAKGLVKKGRARFIDEHTICMTRPPEQTEEQIMSNTTNAAGNSALLLSYLLEQIEYIAKNTVQIDQVISELKQMGPSIISDATTVPDLAGQAKAEALATAIQCRETTNQRLLSLYEKMYDDLKTGNVPKPDAALHSDTVSLPLPAAESSDDKPAHKKNSGNAEETVSRKS